MSEVVEVPTVEAVSVTLETVYEELMRLHSRLDVYEAQFEILMDNDRIVNKLKEIVSEFSASGGLMTLLGGSLGGF